VTIMLHCLDLATQAPRASSEQPWTAVVTHNVGFAGGFIVQESEASRFQKFVVARWLWPHLVVPERVYLEVSLYMSYCTDVACADHVLQVG
jgi:hypothetical protein